MTKHLNEPIDEHLGWLEFYKVKAYIAYSHVHI
jgi:hypothetical protein